MSQQQVCWDQSLGCNSYQVQSYPNPAYPNPAYPNPGYINPGYINPGYINPGYIDPGYADPGYSSAPSLPPVLLIGLLIWIAISALPQKKKEEPKKTPIEKMFDAIGQYESSRTDSDMRRTQFDYKFKDPCIDECPPKKDKKDDDKKEEKKD